MKSRSYINQIIIYLSYFETRLRISFQHFEDLIQHIRFCEKLKIRNLIIEPLNNEVVISRSLKNKIQDLTSIRIYYRITLNPYDLKEFNQKIQKFNDFSDILAVESQNKSVQLKASKDSRVDILSFSEINNTKNISKGVLSLLNQHNKYLEVSLSPLLIENRSSQSRNFRIIYRTMEKILDSRVKYFFCGDPLNKFDLRNPRSFISICNSLLDIPIEKARMGFEKYPQELIDKKSSERKSEKLQNGVKLIGGHEIFED